MVSGKYFNKGVKALDESNLGHVVRETPDKIVIFGGKNKRYDIPISEIQQVGANVLIGLPFQRLKVNIVLIVMIHFQPVGKILGNLIIKLIWELMKANIQTHYLIKE